MNKPAPPPLRLIKDTKSVPELMPSFSSFIVGLDNMRDAFLELNKSWKIPFTCKWNWITGLKLW